MSVLYTDSILVEHTSYQVQETSKFPDRLSFMIGKYVVLTMIKGTTGSVRHGNQLHEIPLRSLFKVQGYEVKSVHASNADGFIVKCKNKLKIKIGTAYLEPIKVTLKSAVFKLEGKEIELPLDILIPIVRKTVKIKDKKIKKEVKSNGIPSTVIEAVAGAIQEPINTSIPPMVNKVLPNLNIPVLINTIKSSILEEEIFDFEGNDHKSLESAIESNNKYIQSKIQEMIMEEITNAFKEQFKNI